MMAGILVGLLILWAITGWWFVLVPFLALYIFLGIRYGRNVKGKTEAYNWKDWGAILLLWWWFALFTWLNRQPDR